MLKVIFSLVMSAGAAAFLLLVVLGMAGKVDPHLAAAAFGITVIAAGASELGGALIANWDRGLWDPPPGGSPVPAGRLSCLGSGLLLVSFGVLLIGLDRMPHPAQLLAGVVLLLGLVLAVKGGSEDRRRAGAGGAAPTP